MGNMVSQRSIQQSNTTNASQQSRTPNVGQQDRSWMGTFMSACYSTLAVSIVIMPMVGSTITLGLYFWLPLNLEWLSIIFGPIGAFALWLIIAIFWSLVWTIVVRTTRSDGESALVRQIRMRLVRIKEHLEVLKPNLAQSCEVALSSMEDKAKVIAYAEAEEFVKNAENILNKSYIGPLTVFGHEHLAAWRAIHRAEEDLLLLDPPQIALERAMHDKLRIEKFSESEQENLFQLLKKAIKRLEPSVEIYLDGDQPDKGSTENSASKSIEEWNARCILHETRRVVNDLRDDRWEGILHLRNQLVRGLIGAELITFALLSLVIMVVVSNTNPEILATNQSAFITGVTVYIIGAMAGLFGRFYGERDLSGLSTDYGLSMVRLVATPVISGLAGIGGVFITQVFTGLSQNAVTSVSAAFTLTPFNLFTAAIFGLTPNLVMQNLQRMTNEHKTNGREPALSQTRPGLHI